MNMDAVIIYDDRMLAAKALTSLTSATQHVDETLQWNAKPWRLDILMLSLDADAALEDAATAHLIVLAIQRIDNCSPSLLDWLEKWATRRHVPEAALAMLDADGFGEMLSASVSPELSRFASRHGLSLIVGGVNPVEQESAAFAHDLREHTILAAPNLARVAGEQTATAYRSWGINE